MLYMFFKRDLNWMYIITMFWLILIRNTKYFPQKSVPQLGELHIEIFLQNNVYCKNNIKTTQKVFGIFPQRVLWILWMKTIWSQRLWRNTINEEVKWNNHLATKTHFTLICTFIMLKTSNFIKEDKENISSFFSMSILIWYFPEVIPVSGFFSQNLHLNLW